MGLQQKLGSLVLLYRKDNRVFSSVLTMEPGMEYYNTSLKLKLCGWSELYPACMRCVDWPQNCYEACTHVDLPEG